MKILIFVLSLSPIFAYANQGPTSNCKPDKTFGSLEVTETIDLTELARNYHLEARYESHLERDVRIIPSNSKPKVSVNYADGTASTYPRLWCSINGFEESLPKMYEISSTWETCKYVATVLRSLSQGAHLNVVLHTNSTSGSQSKKVVKVCTQELETDKTPDHSAADAGR